MKYTERFAKWLEACSPQRLSIGNTKKRKPLLPSRGLITFVLMKKIEAIHKKTVLIIALTRFD